MLQLKSLPHTILVQLVPIFKNASLITPAFIFMFNFSQNACPFIDEWATAKPSAVASLHTTCWASLTTVLIKICCYLTPKARTFLSVPTVEHVPQLIQPLINRWSSSIVHSFTSTITPLPVTYFTSASLILGSISISDCPSVAMDAVGVDQSVGLLHPE